MEPEPLPEPFPEPGWGTDWEAPPEVFWLPDWAEAVVWVEVVVWAFPPGWEAPEAELPWEEEAGAFSDSSLASPPASAWDFWEEAPEEADWDEDWEKGISSPAPLPVGTGAPAQAAREAAMARPRTKAMDFFSCSFIVRTPFSKRDAKGKAMPGAWRPSAGRGF